MTDRVSVLNELVDAVVSVCDRLLHDYDNVGYGINTYLNAMLAIRLSRSSMERQGEILSLVETMFRVEDVQTWVDERYDIEEITDDFLQTAFLLKNMPRDRRTAIIAVADVMREFQMEVSVAT